MRRALPTDGLPAAVAYRGQVIGVVLTGLLNDGTAGMEAIKRCGGVCIVQDPKDAAYSDMPQNVLNRIKVDYCQVPFNCPGCGGVLWEVKKGSTLRFRCHTGHSFTSQILLAEQTAKIEETLWSALRMFEERKNLLESMSKPGTRGYSASAAERANESEIHIKRIRAMLRSDYKATPDIVDP